MTETAASTGVPVSIQLIGGPTALLEIGGLRLLTNPVGRARARRRRLTTPEGADRLGHGVAGDNRLRVIAAGERITL